MAQHGETLFFLLRQPILCSDDMEVKSSDALLDKEVQTVVIVLPL